MEVILSASKNWMKLNARKCKKLQVCFFREKPRLPAFTIDGQALEIVSSHKVIGLIIQSDLKWSEHITSVVAKCLHILRVLRHGGVTATDLFPVYVALICSILEYCCMVWHYAFTNCLSDQLKKVQKRALHIIYPGHSYSKALQLADCPRLDTRHDDLCTVTLEKINEGGPLSQLTQTRACTHNHFTRNSNSRSLYKCRTDRFKSSFFPSAILKSTTKFHL